MVARPWIWVEPISSAASTTPGQSFLTAGMLAELGAADRRADAKAAVLGADLPQLGDPLHVDHEVGLDQAGAQLHQQVGAARQHPRLTRRAGEQADRRIDGLWGFITHVRAASFWALPSSDRWPRTLPRRQPSPAGARSLKRLAREACTAAPRASPPMRQKKASAEMGRSKSHQGDPGERAGPRRARSLN